MSSSNSTCIVVGAGIIGLTTSIRLLEGSFHVICVAEDIPGDPLTPRYASTAAGAHHLSFAADDDERQQGVDKRTFDIMMEELEAEKQRSGLMKLKQIEFYGKGAGKHLKFLEKHPDFEVHSTWSSMSTIQGIEHAVTFTSLTMDTGPYLLKLLDKFRAMNGSIVRMKLKSLQDAARLHPSASVVINCTGLGSRDLLDVKDAHMYPLRGQVVLLRAPWIKEGRTLQIGQAEGGEKTYVIPRVSGDVIIGGTREANDWNPLPDPETAYDIKRRALLLYPELVPEHLRSSSRPPLSEDLDTIVLKDIVGFRPARTGGFRLEVDKSLTLQGESDAKIPVVHNYGHSGAGWQASWGCAEKVVELVKLL